jgi:cbb3-type cytochrome oxidase subunit 3
MIVFLVAFVAIVVRLFWPSRKDPLERQRFIPLEDDPVEYKREARP